MRRAQAYAAASALWAIALLGVLPATLIHSQLGATALLAGVATVFAIGECVHAVVPAHSSPTSLPSISSAATSRCTP
jgi:hypothetical protein